MNAVCKITEKAQDGTWKNSNDKPIVENAKFNIAPFFYFELVNNHFTFFTVLECASTYLNVNIHRTNNKTDAHKE